MARDLYLVANAAHARLFTREAPGDPLVPLHTLEHPASRAMGHDLERDRHGHEGRDHHTGGTAYEPPLDARRKEHQHFAREIALRLHAGLNAGEFQHLTIFASSPFLGELKPVLDDAVQRTVRQMVDLDLTSYGLSELEQRMAAALTKAPG